MNEHPAIIGCCRGTLFDFSFVQIEWQNIHFEGVGSNFLSSGPLLFPMRGQCWEKKYYNDEGLEKGLLEPKALLPSASSIIPYESLAASRLRPENWKPSTLGPERRPNYDLREISRRTNCDPEKSERRPHCGHECWSNFANIRIVNFPK